MNRKMQHLQLVAKYIPKLTLNLNSRMSVGPMPILMLLPSDEREPTGATGALTAGVDLRMNMDYGRCSC